MTGFLSYRNAEIDFSDLSYASISGKNGAGKSSIGHALSWVLKGVTRVDGDTESVINDYEDKAFVTLTFHAEGDFWYIERTKATGKNMSVRLFRFEEATDEWVQYGDHTNAVNQEKINELIGMSEDALYSMMIFDHALHSGGTRFTKAKPSERRDIITGLLPELSAWADKEARMSEVRKEVGRAIERSRARIEVLEEGLGKSEEKIDMLLEDLDKAPEEIEEEIDKISQELRDLEKQIGDGQDPIEEIRKTYEVKKLRISEKIFATQGKISASKEIIRSFTEVSEAIKAQKTVLERTEERLDKARKSTKQFTKEHAEEKEILAKDLDKETRLKDARDALNDKISGLRSTLKEHSRHADILGEQDPDAGSCIVCEQSLTPSQFEKIARKNEEAVEDLLAEIEELTHDKEALDRKISKVEERIVEGRKIISQIDRDLSRQESEEKHCEDLINDTEKELRDLEERIAGVSRKEIEEEEDALEGFRSRLTDLSQAKDDLDDEAKREIDKVVKEAGNQDLEREMSEIKKQLRVLNEEKKRAIENRSRIATLREGLRENKKDLKREKRELGDLEERYENVNWWVQALSTKGIPSMLLDSILSDIEDAQNEILAAIPGSENLRVEFSQSRENKSRAGSKSVLDIIVHTGDQKRYIESFSSGEQVRLTVSNLFAMIKVFNERHPGLVSTVLLDEPLGTLDYRAVPAFIQVLMSAINQQVVETILVVTHDQTVIDSLPEKVVVERTDTGSVITIEK